MHTTGRMWTLNNPSQDFSVIKEMEVLKHGFPLQAILVKSNSAIRQNATTLLLLKEKTFPLFLPLPCTCSSGSQSAGTLIVPCFMVCSLLSDAEILFICFRGAWVRAKHSYWAWEGRVQQTQAPTFPAASRLLRNVPGAGFCHLSSNGPQDRLVPGFSCVRGAEMGTGSSEKLDLLLLLALENLW